MSWDAMIADELARRCKRCCPDCIAEKCDRCCWCGVPILDTPDVSSM